MERVLSAHLREAAAMTVTLPPKRERPRSGIARGPQREWPRHRAWLRRHQCCLLGMWCEGSTEVAHVRSAANAGIGLKPHDAFSVPLCRSHHQLQHQIGQESFQKHHKIDLLALAREFVRLSPDLKMKESLKEVREWTEIPNLR
jgi:hypothetical protein